MKKRQPSENDFTLDDFRKQLDQVVRLGTSDLIRQIPDLKGTIPEENDMNHWLERIGRMIDAMTPEERVHPARIDVNRRLLIALQSDTQPHEVQQFLHQFEQVRNLMRRMEGMTPWE